MIANFSFWIVLLVGAAWTAGAPARWREPGLAALAVGLVAWYDPVILLVYLGLTMLIWGLVRNGRPARGATAAALALAVGLAACKLLQAWEGGGGPLGLSYLVFRLIHVVVEAGRGQLPSCRNWAEFIHYNLSPALFSAGPLERWDHFVAERRDQVDGSVRGEAVQRLVLGLFKKGMLADALMPAIAWKFGVPDTSSLSVESPIHQIWAGAFRQPAVGDELIGTYLRHQPAMAPFSAGRNPPSLRRKPYSHQGTGNYIGG